MECFHPEMTDFSRSGYDGILHMATDVKIASMQWRTGGRRGGGRGHAPPPNGQNMADFLQKDYVFTIFPELPPSPNGGPASASDCHRIVSC